MHRRLRQLLVAMAASTIPMVGAVAQATGTITGTITDRATQQPIPDAQVVVVGSTRGARTNDQGQYRLASVASGPIRIRVLRLGYEAETRSLNVGPGESVTADFALGATVTRLDQVVVSATGESELRRESGNNVATINVDSVPRTVVNGVSDLLSSRAANVAVRTACRCPTSHSSSSMASAPSATSPVRRSTSVDRTRPVSTTSIPKTSRTSRSSKAPLPPRSTARRRRTGSSRSRRDAVVPARRDGLRTPTAEACAK
jgi:hypothetical protein